MPIDSNIALLTVIADIVTNLAAAAFGAVIVVPITTKWSLESNLFLIIFNTIMGLSLLVIAWELRKLGV